MTTTTLNNRKPNQRKASKTDEAIKITITAIVFIAGAWVILKVSKEVLKELEGMGL